MLTRSATRRGESVAAFSSCGNAACRVEETEEVQFHHLLPFIDRRADGRPEQHHAGIVDKNVQATELSHRAIDCGAGLIAIRDVSFDRQRAAALLADVVRERLETRFASGNHRDRGAQAGERARGGGADAAARAGDQRHHAVQWVILRGHATCNQSSVVGVVERGVRERSAAVERPTRT
jgi:hypothetical protein